MVVKPFFGSMSSNWSTAVKLLGWSQCLRHFFLAVALQCSPFALKVQPAVATQVWNEASNGEADCCAGGVDMRSLSVVPALIGGSDVGNSGVDCRAKLASGDGAPIVAVEKPIEKRRDKPAGNDSSETDQCEWKRAVYVSLPFWIISLMQMI